MFHGGGGDGIRWQWWQIERDNTKLFHPLMHTPSKRHIKDHLVLHMCTLTYFTSLIYSFVFFCGCVSAYFKQYLWSCSMCNFIYRGLWYTIIRWLQNVAFWGKSNNDHCVPLVVCVFLSALSFDCVCLSACLQSSFIPFLNVFRRVLFLKVFWKKNYKTLFRYCNKIIISYFAM